MNRDLYQRGLYQSCGAKNAPRQQFCMLLFAQLGSVAQLQVETDCSYSKLQEVVEIRHKYGTHLYCASERLLKYTLTRTLFHLPVLQLSLTNQENLSELFLIRLLKNTVTRTLFRTPFLFFMQRLPPAESSCTSVLLRRLSND